MKSIPLALLSLTVALLFAPHPARAQGPASNITARVAALEAAVAALQSGQTQLNGRVGKLEGNITAADFAGTYNAAGFVNFLEGGPQGQVGVVTLRAVVTLNAYGTGDTYGTGHIDQQGNFINITEGNPWTKGTGSFPGVDDEGPVEGFERIDVEWSYANGILHISDGTENLLDLKLVVGAGGRILTWAGLGDDGEANIIIVTRLQ